jgi:hypothetical protein
MCFNEFKLMFLKIQRISFQSAEMIKKLMNTFLISEIELRQANAALHQSLPKSGNRAALLPPNTLRTILAIFTAYISNSLNANRIGNDIRTVSAFSEHV